jgi:uncharacterized protein YqeY
MQPIPIGASDVRDPLIRENLTSELRAAGERNDTRALATLRLIQTALKQRDAQAKATGHPEGMEDAELTAMLRTMVEQRRQHMTRCECSARVDEAEQEQTEIEVIERLLPPPLDDAAMAHALDNCIEATGAERLKDTGRVMARLGELFPGRYDPVKARRMLGERLG